MKDFVLNNGTVRDPDNSTTGDRPWEDYMEDIVEIRVQDHVTYIGDYAFAPSSYIDSSAKTEIKTVFIEDATGEDPDRTQTIGTGAFAASKITSLNLPASIFQIEAQAFCRSSELTSLQFGVISDNNRYRPSIREIGEDAFADCVKLERVYAIEGSSEKLHIPSGPDIIGAGAFYNTAIKQITLPDSLVSVGRVLSTGESLEDVHGAFENCSKLEAVQLFNGTAGDTYLTTIGANTFKGATALKAMPELPTQQLATIGEAAFYGLDKMTGTLSIPSTVTEIGARAFWGCSGLTGTLTLPNTLTKIKEGTFSGCSGLTGTLTIPGGVNEIEADAFLGCDGVTGVTFTGVPQFIGARAFKQSDGQNTAPEIYFAAAAGVPTTAVEAGTASHSFDPEDIIVYPEGNTDFEDALTDAADGTKRWKGYRVKKVDSSLQPVYPDFLAMVATGETEPKTFSATTANTVDATFPNGGRGFRLIIKSFAETDDPVKSALDASANPPSANAIYVPYDISLYDYRAYYDGTQSPTPVKETRYIGDITVTMSLPSEIVAAIAQDTAAGRLDNLSDRLSLYTENTGASPIQKLSFTDEGVVNNSRLISFTATHFSEFSLVYEPYVEKAFYVVDLRDDQHGDGKSRLFRGTGEGAPKRETFDVIYGTSEADAEPQNKATNPMNGYFLEIRPDEGEDIREAAWRDDGKGLQLAEKDWLLAPCDIRLFYDDGTGTEGAITEKKTDFGTINIQLPIPSEMTETDRIELLTLSYEGKLERGTERNGAFRVATRTDGNASQLFAYFEATHFSEYALYYVLDSAASDTSTTASTSSSEATTATGATTSSAAGGTTATGAGTSNAAAAGSTATGANTASTATTATTSSTLASGASVAASTGGSGATNRAGATTPVAVTTGSSGSASGSDMPTTGDSDFYRMTLSMALMLFGAYELISTIRIRKKGNR
ncbi:MAG: leucine-rich repeat domain-containing protein [Lachnospiraceae bacterium]|nr:leucine-rich repeat domain-containing protein [Lachnospiraceae bacterium]